MIEKKQTNIELNKEINKGKKKKITMTETKKKKKRPSND